ncbi:hypothetical protein Q3G72_003183 [Acer saccharum]|nr:hypothetical protein Q3G72_003183 [Acer saccharum]
MTAYMQSNDQRANSHGASLKKMETQLAQLLDAVVKQNKGKSPSTNEHINVLEVVEEEVEKVVGPEIIPNQVRVLDHSTKVDVDNVVKGTKNEEREKVGMVVDILSRNISFSCGGKSINFKVDRPKESQVDDCLVLEAPKLRKKRSRVLTLVQALEGIFDMKKGNHDCLNEEEAI